MIVIITGATHTGKTVLAQRLLEDYRYPYLSVDHLKMGLIRSGNTGLTPEDDDRALTEYLWPITREIIKTAAENRQNLIVEGCYIPYNWRESFDEQYLREIRFICLVMTEQYIDDHFDEIKAHASDVEARPDDGNCSAGSLKEDNRRVLEGFRGAREDVILISSGYEQAVADAVRRILRHVPGTG